MLHGPYEADARIMWREGIPDDFANRLWPDDLDRLETYLADAIERVPTWQASVSSASSMGRSPIRPTAIPI